MCVCVCVVVVVVVVVTIILFLVSIVETVEEMLSQYKKFSQLVKKMGGKGGMFNKGILRKLFEEERDKKK